MPELGKFTATRPPIVVLTSNRTRDVHDALKRRCLYHWVEHPDFEREVAIVRMRVPNVIEPLARQVAAAVEAMRGLNLYKPPGVAETIDWAQALGALGVTELDEATVDATLGTVLKYREDQERVRQHGIADMVKQAFERGIATALSAGAGRAPRRPSGWPSPSPACCAAPALRVPIGSVLTFVEALGRVGLAERDERVLGGRATLVHQPGGPRRCSTGPSPCSGTSARPTCSTRTPEIIKITLAIDDDSDDDDDDDDAAAEPNDDPTLTLRFSAVEVLRNKDFAAYDDDELAARPAADGRLRFVGPPRRSFRYALGARGRRPDLRSHAAQRDRRRRRADPPPLARAGRAPAPAGAAARRQRLDGALRPGAAALRARRRRRPPAGRGVRLGTRLTRVTRELNSRDPDLALRAGQRAGAGLERRHPARRMPASVQRRVGRARHGPRRDRRDPHRRLGPRRPRRCWASRCSGCSASPTTWSGSTR